MALNLSINVSLRTKQQGVSALKCWRTNSWCDPAWLAFAAGIAAGIGFVGVVVQFKVVHCKATQAAFGYQSSLLSCLTTRQDFVVLPMQGTVAAGLPECTESCSQGLLCPKCQRLLLAHPVAGITPAYHTTCCNQHTPCQCMTATSTLLGCT